jgi:phage terminase large subunit-like protein
VEPLQASPAVVRRTLSSTLSTEAIDRLLNEASRALSYDSLARYTPYPKQQAFHDLGATMRERLLRAGNQQGKSFAGGREAAFHLTGEYPDSWKGKRFNRPVLLWASGETAESTRDNAQKQLVGEIDEWGTGAIPKRCLGDKATAAGTADLLDYVKVRHKSGGWSTVRFKYYAQGRKKWQGPKVDVVWFDEEPPEDIYTEGLARTIASGGMAYITATLLLGMSKVVSKFLMEESADAANVQMTIEDAEHISPDEREKIIRSFPAHEREARTRGVPIMGSGRVFPVEEALIEEPAIEIPAWWPRIAALDFGWDHPTAVIWGAWDRDNDIVHLYDAYRVREQPVPIHAAAIRARGVWIPVAWPHDGNNDTAAGPQLAQQYRDEGIPMLPKHAQYQPTSHEKGDDNTRSNRMSVEAGVQDMLTRMLTGRLKVAKHLHDWWEEFRLYHREEGKIVKVRDDLMSATRYLLMSLENAIVPPIQSNAVRNRPKPNWRT